MTDEEKIDLLKKEPTAKKWVRRFTGADEFLNGTIRWGLWLVDIDPGELNKLPLVKSRVAGVQQMRLASKASSTRSKAATPTLFAQIAQPNSDYLLIPLVSSERRHYIPIGFLPKETIASNLCCVVPSATCFHLGILSSHMHMAWMRQVCGRLESRYRYSKDIVYNNYPWPVEAMGAQRTKVEEWAQAVLDAREPFLKAGSTLADLYDPLTMPPALHQAHEKLDRAVDKCYRKEPFHSDRERVEFLFQLYEKLTDPIMAAANAKPKRRR